MRKALGFMAALLVFGAAAVGWCAQTVYAAHDQVRFTQTILSGDPAAADGLSVQTHATYGNRLFWDSTTKLQDGAPQTQTEYHFFNTEQEQPYDQSYQGVEIYSAVQSSGSNFRDTPKYRQTGLERVYQELYDSAATDKEIEKTIMVADYCEYYPLEGFVSLEGINHDFGIWTYGPSQNDSLAMWNKLQEFFRIPVLPTERITISLTKNRDGSLATGSSGNDEGDQFYLDTQSVVTPKTCYFTFNNHTLKGNTVDTSLIPGGYGIYALDYTAGVVKTLKDGGTEVTENGCLHLDSLRMVFPIDPTEEFLQLSQWEDDGTLLLYTRRKNDYFLTIIAMDTMQQIQRLKIQSTQADDGAWYNLLESDDFIVTVIDQTATVLLPNGDGTFRIDMQTPNTLNLEYLPWRMDSKAVAYHNGKLAVAYENIDQTTGFRYAPCFDAVIFDNTGLVFLAQYQSSLRNVLTDSYNSNEIVQLVNQNPIEVTWK